VPIAYRGVTYSEPGESMIAVENYYAQLDRANPIERQLRATGWDPLALSLLGYLSSGHANQAAGELASAVSMGVGAIGLLFATAGAGLVWVSFCWQGSAPCPGSRFAAARKGGPARVPPPRVHRASGHPADALGRYSLIEEPVWRSSPF
jgi:hypothetical protein